MPFLARRKKKKFKKADAATKDNDDPSSTKKTKTNKKDNSKDPHPDDATSVTSGDGTNTDMVQEVMADNLDLMLEIILQVRKDEDFAKSVYADCPRLQHMLDQNPDLRPIFEDPLLVRINFETVYKKAGGVLPEDKPPFWKRTLSCIVKHPLFKVFRFLLLIKKLYNCIFGGGFAMIKNCFVGMFFDGPPDMPDLEGEDIDINANAENLLHKEALMKAADHMEDPEVKDQMHGLLQGTPDELDEAIEQDPELKALRESNPLCAELMSDPTTMKILVDPDNLRALSDCPDLIEADFNNPDWSPPDVESIPFDDPDYVDTDAATADADEFADAEGEIEEEGEEEEEEGEEEEEEDEGFMDDYERGDETEGAKQQPNKGKQQQKKNQKKNQNQNGNGGGGFMSTLGTGLVDYMAAETVGMTFTEMTGGGDDMGGMEDAADEAAENAEEAADNAEGMAQAVSAVGEMAASDELDDMAGNVEDTMDNVEEAKESGEGDKDGGKSKSASATTDAAAGGAVAAGGVAGKARGEDSESEEEEEKAEEEEPEKKGRFGRLGSAIGGGLAALGTATKEFAVGAIVGDDLAEDLVEKWEEEDESEEEEEEEDDGDNKKKDDNDNKNKENEKENDQGKEEKKPRRRFRRNKGN